MTTPPPPPPEGVLIETALRESGLSRREAARRAGISEGWWRQVVRGYQTLSGGAHGEVKAPPDTVARMAATVGITPAQMQDEGRRPDAAEVMRETGRRDERAGGASRAVIPLPIPPASAGHPGAVIAAAEAIVPERYRARTLAAVAQIFAPLLEAVARTGTMDPPGNVVFGEGTFDAESWEHWRADWPSPVDRALLMAMSRVVDAEENAPGRHGTGR